MIMVKMNAQNGGFKKERNFANIDILVHGYRENT
jgi:hypothetical protein